MLPIVAALWRRSHPDLVQADPRDGGVRAWLTTGSFMVDPGSTSQRLILRNIVKSEFFAHQLFDFQRFALSSFESLVSSRVDANRPKALGWPLLKAYYSAFFGAHALVRSAGQSVIRIEAKQASVLGDLASIAGLTLSVQAGTYALQLVQNANLTLDVILEQLDESGGVHAVFWRTFCRDYLSRTIENETTSGAVDANEAIGKLTDLKAVLTARGANAGTWLSQIRNSINYQHEYGVWFPFATPRDQVDHIRSLDFRTLPVARLDFDRIKQPVQAFCIGGLFIARLSYDLSCLFSDNTSPSFSFPKVWKRLRTQIGASL